MHVYIHPNSKHTYTPTRVLLHIITQAWKKIVTFAKTIFNTKIYTIEKYKKFFALKNIQIHEQTQPNEHKQAHGSKQTFLNTLPHRFEISAETHSKSEFPTKAFRKNKYLKRHLTIQRQIFVSAISLSICRPYDKGDINSIIYEYLLH